MPSIDASRTPALTAAQIERFTQDGFIRIDRAFPPELAAQGRAIMWRDLPCAEDDPASWSSPVILLPGYGGEPFRTAANTPILHTAFDALVGRGRWARRDSIGAFLVRFPHAEDPGDAGWHVDRSFPGPDCDPGEQRNFSRWRINVTSRDRALLMLFLFSDVGPSDAPTRIRVGSHGDVARLLEPFGEAGSACSDYDAVGSDRPVTLATGAAGTVYLCHPFLVHAAQPHRGTKPRFMGQPPLGLIEPYRLDREDGTYSPVESAIRRALRKR